MSKTSPDDIQLVLCECNSFDCSERIPMSLRDYLDINRKGWIVIANDCRTGLEPTDVLIKERKGYRVVRSAEE